MLILIESEAELTRVRGRLAALAHALGPTVELNVELPCGRTIQHLRGGLTPAARVRSLNERLEGLGR